MMKAVNGLKMQNKLVAVGVVCFMAALSLPFTIPMYIQIFCGFESVLLCGLGEPQFYGVIMFIALLVLGTVSIFSAYRIATRKSPSKKIRRK